MSSLFRRDDVRLDTEANLGLQGLGGESHVRCEQLTRSQTCDTVNCYVKLWSELKIREGDNDNV